MSIHVVCRSSIALCLVALMAGCGGKSTSRLFSECTWNRDACMYEGAYEPGEEAYAEEQAKRLNRSQMR